MIESLEERANRARQSIEEVTGSVANREFDPPSRNVGTVLGVVFALALAAVGVLAIARSDGPRAADVAADGPDAVSASEDEPTVSEEPSEADAETPVGGPGPIEPGAFLVFEPAPAGFEPMILAQSLADAENVPTFSIYGTPGDDPFANGDLAVASITVEPGEALVDVDTPSIEVDGQTIYLEEDEDFNVVSWFRDEEGTGLLSRSFTQDELVVLMTGLVQNGELDTKGLSLLQKDAALSFSRFGGEGTVVYQPTADGPASEVSPVSAMVISSLPADNDRLLMDWFELARDDGDRLLRQPEETVEHNGWTVEARPSVDGGFELRFEVDGVPILVTVLGQGEVGVPSLEDALLLLGDIRGATPAEVEAMTIRGDETTAFGSPTD